MVAVGHESQRKKQHFHIDNTADDDFKRSHRFIKRTHGSTTVSSSQPRCHQGKREKEGLALLPWPLTPENVCLLQVHLHPLLDQEHLSAAESSPVYSGVESTTDEDR